MTKQEALTAISESLSRVEIEDIMIESRYSKMSMSELYQVMSAGYQKFATKIPL